MSFEVPAAGEVAPESGDVTHDSGVHPIGETLPEIAEPIFGTLQRSVVPRAVELALKRKPTMEDMDTLYLSGAMERFMEGFRETVAPRIESGTLNESHRKDAAVIEALAVELAPLIEVPAREQAA